MVARRTLFSTPFSARKRMRMSPSPAMLIAAKRALRDSSEFKFKITEGPFFNGDTAGVNTSLTTIAQGVDTDDRIGNRITMTRLDVSLLAKDTKAFRVIIYVPKVATSNIGNSTFFDEGVDSSRYWVLHDEIYSSPTNSNINSTAVNLKINKRMQITYGGNAGASFEKNPIQMYCVAERLVGGSVISGHAKLWYKDM